MPASRMNQSLAVPSLTKCDESGDVIFSFDLHPVALEGNPEHALQDFFRGQIQDLLRVVGLTHKGRRIFVDGFHFVSDASMVLPLWPEKEDANPTRDSETVLPEVNR